MALGLLFSSPARPQINLQQRPQFLQPLRRHPIHETTQKTLLARPAEDRAADGGETAEVLVPLLVLAEGDGGTAAFDGGTEPDNATIGLS